MVNKSLSLFSPPLISKGKKSARAPWGGNTSHTAYGPGGLEEAGGLPFPPGDSGLNTPQPLRCFLHAGQGAGTGFPGPGAAKNALNGEMAAPVSRSRMARIYRWRGGPARRFGQGICRGSWGSVRSTGENFPEASQSKVPPSTITPPSDIPCPPINLVAEWTTISAVLDRPDQIGHAKGVVDYQRDPALWAMRARASISGISELGFPKFPK